MATCVHYRDKHKYYKHGTYEHNTQDKRWFGLPKSSSVCKECQKQSEKALDVMLEFERFKNKLNSLTKKPNKPNNMSKKISGSGKKLEGLEWSNLLAGYCPKCDGDTELKFGMYRCEKCDFVVTKVRYDELCEEMENE